MVRFGSCLGKALLVAVTLGLSACAGQEYSSPQPSFLPSLLGGGVGSLFGSPSIGKTSGNIALLVPLTGKLAAIGQSLANAAKLAVPDGSTPALDIRDTGGTPSGAAAAAQAAIATGDGVILGPLTSAEAKAVAPVAQAAQVNVLAFTNDGTVAASGIWPLGITPTEQVSRVLQQANADGHTQLAALLPDNDFGHQLGNAINTTRAVGAAPVNIVFYSQSFQGVNSAVKQISNFASRGAGIQKKIKEAEELGTPEGRKTARELQHQPIAPPPFNALFIGATSSDSLAEFANFLPYYDVTRDQVAFLGPTLWGRIAPEMAHQSVFLGAIYAAPDRESAATFQGKYLAAYNSTPPQIADVAFDAATIVKSLAQNGGYTSAQLTTASGFNGADGPVILQANGNVLRGLAVMQIEPGAPVVKSPAATPVSHPG